MFGRYGQGVPDHLRKRVKEINEGKFTDEMDKIATCSTEELRTIYTEREKEPE
jgi:hypothetical protein